MEKIMKYDFEFKLKFLNFFYLFCVIPPLQIFSKYKNRGRITPRNTVYLNIFYIIASFFNF